MDHSRIHEVVSNLLKELSLDFSDIEISEEENIIRVDIVSSAASKIIGWHGETLNSIQHIVKAVLRTQLEMERSPFLVLDVDNYRRDQEQKVCNITLQKADFVRRTGNRVALPPMSPYFRRIVHLFVANNADMQDLTTVSTGDGNFRQIVLQLKNAKAKGGPSGELSPIIESEPVGDLENLDI